MACACTAGRWRCLSLNELARAADLDKAQMSRIVAGLDKAELVAREEEVRRGARPCA